MIWKKEIPEDFNAINSDFSERFPIVIIEESRTAKGKAIGTNVHDAQSINSKINDVSNPFPIKSSIYFQRNCIKRIKITIEKVYRKGFIKAIRIDLFNFFKINV